MKNYKIFSLLMVLVIVTSCAKIYYSPDAYKLASNQQTVAILMPSVSIAAGKRVEAEALKEQQRTEAVNFQKEMYSWMLRRKMQGMINKEIQEIEYTNAVLKKAGYPETPMTTEEICALLKVDGLISSNWGMSKPMSDGAAVALGLLAGAWGSTNEVRATLSITDCNDKKLIWNYEYKLSGGVGSSPSRLVDQLMRGASQKMPYGTPNQ
jgi:hypothetical protein